MQILWISRWKSITIRAEGRKGEKVNRVLSPIFMSFGERSSKQTVNKQGHQNKLVDRLNQATQPAGQQNNKQGDGVENGVWLVGGRGASRTGEKHSYTP